MRNLRREEITAMVACPTCKAKAGDKCTKKGQPKKANHHTRLVAAQKKAGLGKKSKQGKPQTSTKKVSKPAKAGFYSSWDWKKARYEAIKKFEQRCMCCGWQPGDTERGYLVVDHIKPRRKYPELELDLNNLQVLCNDCNMGKSNDSEDDWRSMDEQFKATVT